MRFLLIILSLCCSCGIGAKTSSPLTALYNTLDPLSVSEHLAFYELYAQTPEGEEALKKAWQLLNASSVSLTQEYPPLPKLDIQSIIALITRQSFDAPVKLSVEQFTLINTITEHLANRRLKGHQVWTKEQVLALPSEEIDLSRALLLYQFEGKEHSLEDIQHYEAMIDIMSLQIAARLPNHPNSEDKIHAINQFIFHEMRFRFPPHSLYAKDIDLYTFLPSVLDNRQGVCLGVSILYLCIAQRLDLPLEIITPPGHIYLRYCAEGQLINIETTARGINPPSDIYLGINTRLLQKRDIKEVVGLAFVNQASVYWSKQDYDTTVSLYEKALLFLPNDPLVKMLLGFNYLFTDRKKEASQLFKQISPLFFDEAISPETLVDDYLNHKVDANGIKTVFLSVDESRESILKKQKELQAVLKHYPHFRAGLMHLATTWFQLGRGNEAKEALERYHRLDPHNAIVEYYLCVLCIERLDYNRAWAFLRNTQKLVYARAHYPKALDSLRAQLRRYCPEP